jgi:tetratricopeptide (TPR) repeat protein
MHSIQAPDPKAVPFLPWESRLLVVGDALTFYLRKLIFFNELFLVDYSRNPAAVLGSPFPALGLLVLLVVIAGLAAVKDRSVRKKLGVGLALFLLPLLPVSGLRRFDFQEFSTVADRYAYLSLLGPALLVALFAPAGKRTSLSRGKLAYFAGLSLLLVSLTVKSGEEVGHWKNSLVLLEYTVEKNPRSRWAYDNVGLLRYSVGNLTGAIESYQRAIEISPHREPVLKNLIELLVAADRVPEAATYFEELSPRKAETPDSLTRLASYFRVREEKEQEARVLAYQRRRAGR